MLTLALASVLSLGDVLAAGSAAPALSVEKFLKGEAVSSFEPGKVYVLEFWATWCGPCIRAMPHVSKLQKEHPEVTVIGVAGFERAPDAAAMEKKVQEFLDGRGSDVGFRIALDTDGSMAQEWMNAAKRRTIPTSMVVGKDGKVAFVGSPNAELDAAVIAALGKDPVDPTAKDPASKKSPEPGTTEEVTTEPTDEKGESVSESTSSSSSTSTVNGVTVTQTVTETVRVEVRNGTKTTTKRRTVTRSDAPKP
jgi:thiol-disulfide isomerase/thioredoxin